MVRGGSQQAEGEGGGLLSERDLEAIERAHPEGLSSAQVVEVFHARSLKLSEIGQVHFLNQVIDSEMRRSA